MGAHQGATAVPVIADFRSDTVTQATPEMREAMAQAPVGDDVYNDDPTVARLQEAVADLAGKESALFFPSGTQSNLSAILSQCGRGDEYITGVSYHLFSNEAGGAAALGGVVPCPLAVDAAGSLSPEAVRAAVKADDPHLPISRLLSLENTVSGQVQPRPLINALAETGQELGLRVHLDGARLWNAAVATGEPWKAFLHNVDTVSLCLSKGLGAPIGSILAGDSDTINRAVRARKMLGGGMRQVGHLAAAGLYALENHVDRLADDHANAKRLSLELAAIDRFEVSQATNMVFVEPLAEDRHPLAGHLRSCGVLTGGYEPAMRIVCHLGIGKASVDTLVEAFRSYYHDGR